MASAYLNILKNYLNRHFLIINQIQ